MHFLSGRKNTTLTACWRQPKQTGLGSTYVPRDLLTPMQSSLLLPSHTTPWKECTTRVPATPGSKKKVFKYRRRTTATALQLAVDHAFTGSYAKRFRPKDPPESITCKCGAKLRDPNHILRRCSIFHDQRVNTAIHASFRTLSLKQLFNDYPDRLLVFLQAPGITHPQTGPQLWVEEETEQGIG